ncbi:hypothetical protein ACKTEK_11150 [Tepidamorphus sp. 3E244]|uniref:phosphorylase family protein n=1 Tax=Tepidamorphus sp. 3E244 TaxID=3385498 RepID=UPI0038FC77E1
MNRYDVLIYCPLLLEFEAVYELFKFDENYSEEFDFPVFGGIVDDTRLLLVTSDDQNSIIARKIYEKLALKFDFGVVFCIGICGALSNDLSLGDVCYNTNNLDLNHDQKFGVGRTSLSPKYNKTDPVFVAKMNLFRTDPTMRSAREDWQENCRIWLSDRDNFDCSDFEYPTILSGPIVTYGVVADKDTKKRILELDRKILAVETELSGIFDACGHSRVISIRGVSDLADNSKNALEASSRGVVRQYAARNAALYFKTIIQNAPPLVDYIVSVRSMDAKDDGTKADPGADIFEKIKRSADHRLRAASPEYRDQGPVEWIPAPRVMSLEADSEENFPVEIVEALEDNRAILVNLPMNYPSQGLVDLYTLDMLGKMMLGKNVLPIVVDFVQVAPPKDLQQAIYDVQLDEIKKRKDISLVFIVSNYNPKSKSRSSHLFDMLKDYPDSFILAFVGSEVSTSVDGYADIIRGWSQYRLESVSLENMKRYLVRSHKYTEDEAETIAIRLTDTFDEFDLPIHPSYFVNIPRELLQRLIDANRRAELIELAVFGFLTFAVVGDEDRIVLSRTTRQRFLTMVAKLISVDKEKFDRKKLEELASIMAKQYDFDINPRLFIDGLCRNYIISFNEDGLMEFSLPFVRAFLLADYFRSNLADAKSYFQFDDEGFDFSAFNIFAEIGDVSWAVDEVCRRLDEDVSTFDALVGEALSRPVCEDRKHVLEDASFVPILASNQKDIANVRKNIERAAQEALDQTDSAGQKQILMDIRRKTREVVSGSGSSPVINKGKSRIVRDWQLAATLLGGGSESLEATRKRALATRIIELTCEIIDDWMWMIKKRDYSNMASVAFEQIMGDADLANRISDREAVKDYFSSVFAQMELRKMEGVVCSMVGNLSDICGGDVLAKTVTACRDDRRSREMIRCLWLVALDEDAGLKATDGAIRKFPKRIYPRVLFAKYLILRAYWNAKSRRSRENITETANNILKPLPLSVSGPDDQPH